MSRVLPDSSARSAEKRFLFTSESVSEGHPDKLCDRISDAILDECLRQDSDSLVACETCVTRGTVMVFGEICTKAALDVKAVVRRVVRDVGYDDDAKGLNYQTMTVLVHLSEQSSEIRAGLHMQSPATEMGAGDQGIMFGYATDETPEYMPMSHVLALRITKYLTAARKSGRFSWLWPDGKSQVTLEYATDPQGGLSVKKIHTVVVSQQHTPLVSVETLREEIRHVLVNELLPKHLVDDDTVIHINPCGPFTHGGPAADSGLTGRKIICDTYGGWGAHGGGAFSGKDCTKVDRSGAYAARQIAKTLVANNLCKRALVQISYSIGIAHPLSLHVDTYGSAVHPWTDEHLCQIIQQQVDLRPGIIRERLCLTSPIFEATAVKGHFGVESADFLWELPHELCLDKPIEKEETHIKGPVTSARTVVTKCT